MGLKHLRVLGTSAACDKCAYVICRLENPGICLEMLPKNSSDKYKELERIFSQRSLVTHVKDQVFRITENLRYFNEPEDVEIDPSNWTDQFRLLTVLCLAKGLLVSDVKPYLTLDGNCPRCHSRHRLTADDREEIMLEFLEVVEARKKQNSENKRKFLTESKLDHVALTPQNRRLFRE